MADNTLPPEGLSGASALKLDQRRAFLRRAVAVGVPVVLATVKGRSVLAQGSDEASISGCASMHPSGWLSRGNAKLREENCTQVEPASITGDPLEDERLRQEDRLLGATPDPTDTDPYALPPDPLAPPPDPLTVTPEQPADTYTYRGKGKGKGGKKK